MIHSGFITGMDVKDAIKATIRKVEETGIGYGTINYRLRDAIFSRQRYWGEPFPVYYKNGMPYALPEEQLPLELPEVDAYLPTESGEPPLARAKNWVTKEGYLLETNTMPGFAGSSAYYLRYMDPRNQNELVSKEARFSNSICPSSKASGSGAAWREHAVRKSVDRAERILARRRSSPGKF